MAKKFYKESELLFEEKPKHGSFQDLTGQKFNRLTVLGFAGGRYWFCKCDCNNLKKVWVSHLKSGAAKSCGCFNKERTIERNTTHGHAKKGELTSTFSIWQSMLARCKNPKNKGFKNYGGRGITVCKSWQESFHKFLSDMGERPAGLSLDRKENNKGYCKENCRWVTMKEQNNNRRNNRVLTFNGKTQTMAQWADELGINQDVIYARLKYGWPTEKALTTPIKITNRHASI